MTKEKWIEHIKESFGTEVEDIKGAAKRHLELYPDCPECKARLKTMNHNRAARVRHAIMTDMGLKRVRGSLGGIYYE
jgi:hypothetical protein